MLEEISRLHRNLKRKQITKVSETKREANLILAKSAGSANPLKQLPAGGVLHHNSQMCRSKNNLYPIVFNLKKKTIQNAKQMDRWMNEEQTESHSLL